MQKVGLGPVGVMTYLTTPGEVPELARVWFILEPHPDEQLLKPVMFPPVGAVNCDAVQVKVVPVVAEVIPYPTAELLHTVVVEELFTVGFGSTCTVVVTGSPTQLVGAGPVGIIV